MRKIILGGILLLTTLTINANDSIIFWEYSNDISIKNLEDLENVFLRDISDKFIISLEIPLDEIKFYYWEEQLFCISEKKIEELWSNVNELYNKSKDGYLFFSIVIDSKVVISGLNRIMPITAEALPSDNMLIPKLTLLFTPIHQDAYFRLVYNMNLPTSSIWDIDPVCGKVTDLFKKDLYAYFNLHGKLKRGKYDIERLFNEGLLVKIN
jgi:hypothetical protein